MNFRRQSNTFQFEEDPFSENVQGIGKNHHEVLKFKILKTKPLVESMTFKNYDLYYTVIKNRDCKEIVNDDEYETDFF